MSTVKRVAVTGAAGQIGYSLLPLIANGGIFGPNVKVALQLLDRATRQPLIEAHVRFEARIVDDSVLPALYEAALQGFPNLPAGERRVTVSLNPGRSTAAAPAASVASK